MARIEMLRCPACGSEGEFVVGVVGTLVVEADLLTIDNSGAEVDTRADASCRCAGCWHDAPIATFNATG